MRSSKRLDRNYKDYIQNISDFPIKGIQYKDIQPLLADTRVFENVIEDMGDLVEIPNYWVGIESRGFLFASALAFHFGGGVRMIRKKGKLPKIATISQASVENKNVCLKFNLNSLSKLAKINRIPINIVTKEDETKL